MESLIRNSTECVMIGQTASQGNYILTNNYLVDYAKFLIAVSEHTDDLHSGMTQVESYAHQKSLSTIFINPDTAEARGFLGPNLDEEAALRLRKAASLYSPIFPGQSWVYMKMDHLCFIACNLSSLG